MVRALYVDLDGTLLGHRGSLFHDEAGAPSIRAAQAVFSCLQAGVEVVLMSGRGRSGVAESARLLGQRSYVFEAGACLVLDRSELWLTGRLRPGERTIADQISSSGALELLLERYARRLVLHDDRHGPREASVRLCGNVDPQEADLLLADQGFDYLHLIDNGLHHHPHPSAGLMDAADVRAYVLAPAEASKAAAVGAHRQARGLLRHETAALGDSPEDLLVADEVGQLWLVGTAVACDSRLAALLAQQLNVRLSQSGPGAAVDEAVGAMLQETATSHA